MIFIDFANTYDWSLENYYLEFLEEIVIIFCDKENVCNAIINVRAIESVIINYFNHRFRSWESFKFLTFYGSTGWILWVYLR